MEKCGSAESHVFSLGMIKPVLCLFSFNGSSLVLCDDLDGWNEGVQEEGGICICTADSCWYTAKTNTL